MRNVYCYYFALIFLIFLTSCKKDDAVSPANPKGGIGLPGENSVTFQVNTFQGNQGINFHFVPNTAVTATKITLNLQEQQFQDIVSNPNPEEIYDANNGFSVGEYSGVLTGQKWTFLIEGKIGNSQGQQYNTTASFTVP